MEIKKIDLEYARKNSFSSTSFDGIRHIKTLPYISVVQAVIGNYDIQLGNGKAFNTGNGGFFIAPSNVQQTIIHNANQPDNNMFCRWVFLKIKLNDIYDLDALYDFPVIIPDAHKNEMNSLFDRLFSTDNLFDEYVCYYEIVRLLAVLSKDKEYKPSPYIDIALTHIKNNYDRKITVKDIAREVNLSQSHLFSVFKKEMDTSPITYLNNYRLSVAADELLKTDKTITEIADMVGIDDPIYFNKLFRKAYQTSPSEYRKIHEQNS